MCEKLSKEINVEFGEIETGAVVCKMIEIINISNVEQTYEAYRDAITNPLDYVFELHSYSWTLSPGQVYKCKIYYRPFVPFSINIDYFTIVDSTGESVKITTRGTCIGPIISSSTTKLTMVCTSECGKIEKRFKLINKSDIMAIFMFDVKLIENLFKVNPEHGHIKPHSRKYITITFAPREIGFYTRYLPCLILHHKPIVIEIYGYCTTTLPKINILDCFAYPTEIKNGFEGYTSDSIIFKRNLPTISLSKNYINFGQANVETKLAAHNIPQTFSLTNHSQSDVLIKWCQDSEKIFNITPVIVKIPANQTALFEVVFNPNSKNNLFVKEVIGYILSIQQQDHYFYTDVLAFPTITSIRFIGHSFSAYSDDWLPQYEIPHVVRMPPSLPCFLTYTTFIIRKFDNLPLMYCFIPPASSRFIVKPMMGIINQSYQIIVVGMLPEIDESIYEERWIIHFNGNTKLECSINFRGFTECANFNFNDQKNITNLMSTFPGCRQTHLLRIRNITRHTIRYEFVNVPPELHVQNISGEIYSNDIVFHEWEFCPSIIGDYKWDLNYILIILKDGIPIGSSISAILHVKGKCELGFLTATPDELNFGVLAYKATKTLSFRVFNSSPVNIHYKMIYCYLNSQVSQESDIKIEPISDTIPPGQDKTITVSVTFFKRKHFEIVIKYLLRISPYTDAIVVDQMPKPICKLRCTCLLPTLQVIDLQCFGPSPEMSKVFLWKLMKINELNTIFSELEPGMSKELIITLPKMILCKDPIVIRYLIMCPIEIFSTWTIKRMQICSCTPVIKSVGLSFSRTTYEDCVHRKICTVNPNKMNLNLNEEDWLTVEIFYTLLGKNITKWNMDLGDNRHIYMSIIIEGLCEPDRKLGILGGLTYFKFQEVYLGDKNAVYQVCWLHNGTNHSIPFSINPKTIYEINQKYCYEVFSCATMSGIVNPLSCLPLLLKFQPRHFGTFKGKLLLIMGKEKEELTLEAESLSPIYKPMVLGEVVPSKTAKNYKNILVYFNIDFLDIPCMATHSHVVKMLIVYNNSLVDVFTYEWKRIKVLGVIQIDIHPRKGVLKPMSMKTLCVTIYTEKYPCVLSLNVPCEFLNACERRNYQKSVYKYEDLSKELEGQFIITEKGVSVPKPWLKILEKPQPFFKTITIRCFIYSEEDKFLKINLKEELINTPQKQISLEEDEKCKMIFKKEDINRSSFIIEGLLWEVVNSNLFNHLMEDILQKKTNLFYSQFRMNLYERKRLIKRSCILPSRELIACILEKILFIIMHEEFGLNSTHLFEHVDIRHKSHTSAAIDRKNIIKRKSKLYAKEYFDYEYKPMQSRKISFPH